MVNPWKVDSIDAFTCLMCPECIYVTKDENLFQKHASDNHPLSFTFFEKLNAKKNYFVEKTSTDFDLSRNMQTFNLISRNEKSDSFLSVSVDFLPL